MKIKSIVLDFDNTLYAEKEYFVKIFERFCEIRKIEYDLIKIILSNFDYIRINEKDIFSFVLKKINYYSVENHNLLFKLYTEITTIIYPYEGINTFINELISKKIGIYVLTNGIIVAQKNKWKCLFLENKNRIKFHPSREFGQDKPSAITFTKMLNIINIPPEDILFIGDRFDNDIKWAIDNNSNGILFNTNEICQSTPSFNNTVDLWNYIQSQFNF